MQDLKSRPGTFASSGAILNVRASVAMVRVKQNLRVRPRLKPTANRGGETDLQLLYHVNCGPDLSFGPALLQEERKVQSSYFLY